MPSMGHLYRWSLCSEQKAKIMKNRIQSLNYSSYHRLSNRWQFTDICSSIAKASLYTTIGKQASKQDYRLCHSTVLIIYQECRGTVGKVKASVMATHFNSVRKSLDLRSHSSTSTLALPYSTVTKLLQQCCGTANVKTNVAPIIMFNLCIDSDVFTAKP